MTTPEDNPFAPRSATSTPPSPQPIPYTQAPTVDGPPRVALPPTNGSAIAAFVLSLFGVVPLVSIVAIILGRFAQSTVSRTGEGGYGLAKAAVIIGIVGVALWLLVIVFVAANAAGGIASV